MRMRHFLRRLQRACLAFLSAFREQMCRECGCTDWLACCNEFGEACHWVEPDLCSACADPEEAD